ncbi:integrase family protein : Uncharacterized protein OS=Acinetobacter soli NIPH 2899 GN=F950_02740 PE=4 SV=1: Phage_integrase [Gemmata massiliana]|uniref:Tyr recombinase domain-containing protein n=1 Tax=Gemmata massiliana TaxID=1210884 RepID=A0A6P2D6W6_9BACT|nr:site-specific integrase [Gemmata massiliana]VTR95222.1 integrase family protein : Uncharacterized protein OS=Acinetobacter soli NIPH 2899 GN=F950_02740 PE=4 SV=1: Phage_integrase [Gemmata massiliana]
MTLPTDNGADNVSRAQFHQGMFTLQHLIDSYVTHSRLMVSAGVTSTSTLEWYLAQFKHLKLLADFPAEALRTYHLASVELTNAFCRVLKALYKWGTEQELVPKNPFVKLAVPPCGRRERVLTRAELARLYRVSPRQFRRLLFVQLHTLARPGEIRQLTWGQIDWGNRVILLTKFKGQKRRKDKLKARPIPMSWVVYRLLVNMRRKAKDTSPDSRVFRSPRYGRPWTSNGVRCAMRTARSVAGLDGGGERVVCYTLRHTGATTAIRNDVSLKKVAEIMGHTRTTTTERYLHLDTKDMVETIDNVFIRRKRGPEAST